MASRALSAKMRDADSARYLPLIRPDDTTDMPADQSSKIVFEAAEPPAVDTKQEEIDEGTAAHVAELQAAGHGEAAHELAKTIETPAIRQEVDPEH